MLTGAEVCKLIFGCFILMMAYGWLSSVSQGKASVSAEYSTTTYSLDNPGDAPMFYFLNTVGFAVICYFIYSVFIAKPTPRHSATSTPVTVQTQVHNHHSGPRPKPVFIKDLEN